MSAEGSIAGSCLCGAVTLTAARFRPEVSACHCRMCQRWNGAALFCLVAPADAVEVGGPVRRRASSAFAERAWCGECGSHLWMRDIGSDYELSPGLFDAALELPLVREIYADRAMASCRLAGEHRRVSRAEYESDHSFVEGADAR